MKNNFRPLLYSALRMSNDEALKTKNYMRECYARFAYNQQMIKLEKDCLSNMHLEKFDIGNTEFNNLNKIAA